MLFVRCTRNIVAVQQDCCAHALLGRFLPDLGRLWQRRRPLFIYLAVAGAARLLPSPVIEPRDRQHVALVELGEGTAQLRAVGALAVSLKTFSAPAARNCFTCASTLWPSVDKPADSATEFCNKKALNNQPSEFVSNILNYARM